MDLIRDKPTRLTKFFEKFEAICLFFGIVGIISFTLAFLVEMVGNILGNDFGVKLIYLSIAKPWLEIAGLMFAIIYFKKTRKKWERV